MPCGQWRVHAPQWTQLLTNFGLGVRMALAVKYCCTPVNHPWAKLALYAEKQPGMLMPRGHGMQ